MKTKIIEKYGEDIFRRSAINLPGGAEFLKYFMTAAPIKNAVEIGTFRGVTSAVMSQYCNRVYTIDLKHGQYEKIRNNVEWADTPARAELWRGLDIKNIYFFPVSGNGEKRALINDLDSFDFAFIDGDHSYEGVAYDFELVKRCGRVLFHDYDQAPGKKCPVRDFIKSIDYGNLETTKDYAYWTAS